MKSSAAGRAKFINSYLMDKLIKKGCKIVIIDNLSTGKKENLNPRDRFYKINIQDSKIGPLKEEFGH